jgi:sulfoxide reductase heme-binding subunit YedZ
MLSTHAVAAAATPVPAGPSPFWYATRGAGVALLLVLTASVVLGVGTSLRLGGRSIPRFVIALLHRNLGLLSVVLLAVHIVTTILDPFARVSVRDALVPFSAAYRPLWLGLGTVAAEVLVAIAVTSVLRRRIGQRTWRLVHWTAYASWPVAVMHGLGTGSDAQAPWMIGITAACVTAVLLAVIARLGAGWRSRLPLRLAMGLTATASVAAMAVWAVHGPFRPGWAVVAGTPASLLSPGAPPAGHTGPVHRGPGGFSDDLIGTMVRDPSGGTQVALRDVVDPALTLAVRPPTTAETLPVVTVARDGRTVCVAPARAGSSLYAVCGTTRLTIALFGGPTRVTGRLATSGPLG